jgi:hypothetical protein
MRTVTLPAKRFEDFDDCLTAAREHIAHLFKIPLWCVHARWENDQRDNIIVKFFE